MVILSIFNCDDIILYATLLVYTVITHCINRRSFNYDPVTFGGSTIVAPAIRRKKYRGYNLRDGVQFVFFTAQLQEILEVHANSLINRCF